MIDSHLHADWDTFWGRVEQFAKDNNLPLRYVEEEWVIDGELIEDARQYNPDVV